MRLLNFNQLALSSAAMKDPVLVVDALAPQLAASAAEVAVWSWQALRRVGACHPNW